MSEIWDRVYQIDVGFDEELLTVDGFSGEPAQVSFRVTHFTFSYQSIAEVTIFGLSAETRRLAYEEFERIRIVAGYRNRYGEIFRGTIYNTAIGRDGAEVFTTFYCRSVGEEWGDAFINKSWGDNTPAIEVIRDVALTLNPDSIEFVGDFSDLPKLINGLTMSEDSKAAMRSLARNYSFSWTIENGIMIINRLGAVRTDPSAMFVISADSGMVGSPRITQYGIDVTTKMNTSIRTRDKITVENATGELVFNNPNAQRIPDTIGSGVYDALGVVHVGDYYSDTWDTVIQGWSPRAGQLPRTGQ